MLSSTERGYDLLAPKFDACVAKAPRGRLSLALSLRTPDWILDRVMPHIGAERSLQSAIDLCCGTGVVMERLLPLCRHRVIGMDQSDGMLSEAEKRLRSLRGNAAAVLMRQDVLDLHFNEAFDVATWFGGTGHVLPEDQPRFVSAVYRALKPGGKFFFDAWYPPAPWQAAFWGLRAFDLAMRARNAFLKPPFIMYYGAFPIPRAVEVLRHAGFEVELRDLGIRKLGRATRLVIATRPK